jgi:AMP-polyphosphate phosphotransferase
MLELVDVNLQIAKEEYDQVLPDLTQRLGECQRAARAAGVPVVIVFEGWDAAGKGTLINRLAQGLDPRGFQVQPIQPPNEVERRYPWMWRFWNLLPGGEMAIFDRSWYRRILEGRVRGSMSEAECRLAYEEIFHFEQMLADAGAVIVKFWLHIDKAEQKRRFQRLRRDPATAWRVGKAERKQHRKYGDWLDAVEEMLAQTNAPAEPWAVVAATHGRYARFKVIQTVVEAIERELTRRAASPKPKPQPMAAPPERPASEKSILDRVDLSLALSVEEYQTQLGKLQERLHDLEFELYAAKVSAAIVYEGWDAAGKGGNIRRLTGAMDPRGYRVVPVGPPTPEELSHQFLWRFWRNIPKTGHIAVFDRSWYGRVLVERVEGFCSEEDWKRSYGEINEFERELADFRMVVVKFWLHIDEQEQLRRFEERQQTPYKQWKITDDDWRNRDKWKLYERCVNEMLERTSTAHAPWTILESNCKLYARIKALTTVAEALEKTLRKLPP